MGDLLLTPKEIEAFLMRQEGLGKKVQKLRFPLLKQSEVVTSDSADLKMLNDIKLNVIVEVGTTALTIKELLGLKVGDTIELNKLVGELMNVYINEQNLGRGETLVINEEFCIRLNNLVDNKKVANMKEES